MSKDVGPVVNTYIQHTYVYYCTVYMWTVDCGGWTWSLPDGGGPDGVWTDRCQLSQAPHRAPHRLELPEAELRKLARRRGGRRLAAAGEHGAKLRLALHHRLHGTHTVTSDLSGVHAGLYALRVWLCIMITSAAARR